MVCRAAVVATKYFDDATRAALDSGDSLEEERTGMEGCWARSQTGWNSRNCTSSLEPEINYFKTNSPCTWADVVFRYPQSIRQQRAYSLYRVSTDIGI